jgi:site-specific recombinase XerD
MFERIRVFVERKVVKPFETHDSATLRPPERRCKHEKVRHSEDDNPTVAARLRSASPHWMRHTHATYSLSHGAELTTVRDNLRHASIATTSIYLHGDDIKRARQMEDVFGAPPQETNSG